MLTDDQRKLWEAYEAAEGRAPRAEKLRALNTFLDALVISPQADWFPWARSVAEQVVDHGLNFVIRRPLFERAVFPALLAGYQAGLPGSARWLAGLADHLLHNPQCREQLRPDGDNLRVHVASVRVSLPAAKSLANIGRPTSSPLRHWTSGQCSQRAIGSSRASSRRSLSD